MNIGAAIGDEVRGYYNNNGTRVSICVHTWSSSRCYALQQVWSHRNIGLNVWLPSLNLNRDPRWRVKRFHF
jgi:hypothetical protein